MQKKQWIVLAALLAAAALVAWLALSSRQPPLLPGDELHKTFDSADTCLSCHAPDGAVPQSSRHPLGHDCLRCHGSR
jgi:cytochrome c553